MPEVPDFIFYESRRPQVIRIKGRGEIKFTAFCDEIGITPRQMKVRIKKSGATLESISVTRNTQHVIDTAIRYIKANGVMCKLPFLKRHSDITQSQYIHLTSAFTQKKTGMEKINYPTIGRNGGNISMWYLPEFGKPSQDLLDKNFKDWEKIRNSRPKQKKPDNGAVYNLRG